MRKLAFDARIIVEIDDEEFVLPEKQSRESLLYSECMEHINNKFYSAEYIWSHDAKPVIIIKTK